MTLKYDHSYNKKRKEECGQCVFLIIRTIDVIADNNQCLLYNDKCVVLSCWKMSVKYIKYKITEKEEEISPSTDRSNFIFKLEFFIK